MLKKEQGFTLIELMIALVIGSFLILGISATYSAISASIQTSKDLENAQEVIRYSSQSFTRSLKQTSAVNVVSTVEMRVQQSANTSSCLGTTVAQAYQETFTFVQPDLFCSIQDSAGADLVGTTRLLTGINSLVFIDSGNDLITIRVLPDFLPSNFPNTGLDIDIALNAVIFAKNM